MRARLTLLAAGVVAVALVVGGPLWIWGVRYRMEEDLRERERSRSVLDAFLRARGGDRDPWRPRRLPPGPGPPGRPKGDPFPDADVLRLSPSGETEFTGGESGPSEGLLEWLASVRGDPANAGAASDMGELVEELHQAFRDCIRGAFPDGDPEGGLPDFRSRMGRARDACRERVEAARVELRARAMRLDWPQRIVSDPERGRRLWTAVLVRLPGEETARAVAIDSSLESVDATVAALTRSLLFGGPLLLALVAGLAWYLVGRSLAVVGAVQREAEQIAFGTLDRRLEEPRSKDEVARLIVTLNRMLDRVAEGARRQREFVGDASHELRTPIASTRTQLEVALSHPDEADWPKVARGAHEEVVRMQRLVDDLLRIARLDDAPGASTDRYEDVDLDDVVRTECARLREAKVGLAGVSPVRIRGVEPDLRRVVRNLLENAERYGAARIEVSLGRTGGDARLDIEDDGPGIPAERRELVFERFTRLDESRSRAEGGAGLGLSLARGLVEAHGGEIWIEEARLGGARAVVSLPLEP